MTLRFNHRLAWASAFLLIATLGCSNQPKHAGFNYECFERCSKNKETNRDCVRSCTDQQSTSGQQH